ncbi:hypothetical protein H0H92_004414 [Tricholoma furcatifolium]|nr:hypothetical protein H0H92_004414 [Tricholoma furcatifolium]
MATSSRSSPDTRPLPSKDTRTQLFVGNVRPISPSHPSTTYPPAAPVSRPLARSKRSLPPRRYGPPPDVSLGPDNRSRGYGTVLLSTAEDAGRAIDLFHGYSWQTRVLEVRPDRLPPDYDANHPPPAIVAPLHAHAHPLTHAGSAGSGPQREEEVKVQVEYSQSAILDMHHNFPANLPLRSLFVGNRVSKAN